VRKRLYGAYCGHTRPRTHQVAISLWAGGGLRRVHQAAGPMTPWALCEVELVVICLCASRLSPCPLILAFIYLSNYLSVCVFVCLSS
jgi:hypothetical protein